MERSFFTFVHIIVIEIVFILHQNLDLCSMDLFNVSEFQNK